MRMFISRAWLGLVIILPTIGLSQIWVARYNGPNNGWDGGKAIAVDSSGNVYVAGSSDGVGSLYDYALIKYSSSGVEQWVSRYNGLGNGSDEANAIAVDHLGNVYVTGHSEGSGTGADFATIKYNAAGEEQWVARYNGPGNMADGAGGIALDNAGDVYVTGYSVGSGTVSDYATVKYDAAGVEQWVARYNGPRNSYDRSIAIALDQAGNVYVTGTSHDSITDEDYVTIKYDSSGVEQWVARFNGTDSDWDGARAIVLDNMGNVYVTGSSKGVSTDNDYATVKYNPAGVEQWVARYNGPTNHQDNASAIAVDYLSNVYVTGRSVDSDLEDDYATIKYDSFGIEQWVARYDGPVNSYDDARAMDVDNAGNVYVTGYSTGSVTGHDYATVKYNSSGVEQWVERYNGPANACDDALATVVDNSGHVYVTGWSRGPGIGFDFATIKYSCTGVEERETAINPAQAQLTAHPNPFSKLTTISFGVCSRQKSVVSMEISDVTGRVVRQWDNKTIRLSDNLVWHGIDDAGQQLPSGVYVVRLTLDNYAETIKILFVK